MPQIFTRASNTFARAGIVFAVLCLGGVAWATYTVWWSPYMTGVDAPRAQPVPFSHKHHAGELGIDCRYCHTGVESGRFAGLPPTETCMTCHSQIWTDAPLLAPVRASWRDGKAIEWTRVHDLPDFVYFDHSIHVRKGVGCAECHGRVDEMPLTWQAKPLYMKWCLECHRAPEQHVRPPGEVFNMSWERPAEQRARGLALAGAAHLDTTHMMDCSACHR